MKVKEFMTIMRKNERVKIQRYGDGTLFSGVSQDIPLEVRKMEIDNVWIYPKPSTFMVEIIQDKNPIREPLCI